MAIKKSASLRAKATSKLKSSSTTNHGILSKSGERLKKEIIQSLASHNEFLHQKKETKKEKLDIKKESFLQKLATNGYKGEAISKSSLRRLKRKQRGNLNTNLSDLINQLPEDLTSSGSNKDDKFVSPEIRNKPNPKKHKKTHEKMMKAEITQFGLNLTSQVQTPGSAASKLMSLRERIAGSIDKKTEFLQLEQKRRARADMEMSMD